MISCFSYIVLWFRGHNKFTIPVHLLMFNCFTLSSSLLLPHWHRHASPPSLLFLRHPSITSATTKTTLSLHQYGQQYDGLSLFRLNESRNNPLVTTAAGGPRHTLSSSVVHLKLLTVEESYLFFFFLFWCSQYESLHLSCEVASSQFIPTDLWASGITVRHSGQKWMVSSANQPLYYWNRLGLQ